MPENHPSKTAVKRALIASKVREQQRNPGDHALTEAVVEARRDYYTESLSEHIQRIVAKAPPLTTEQAERLAALFRPYIRPTGDGGTDE